MTTSRRMASYAPWYSYDHAKSAHWKAKAIIWFTTKVSVPQYLILSNRMLDLDQGLIGLLVELHQLFELPLDQRKPDMTLNFLVFKCLQSDMRWRSIVPFFLISMTGLWIQKNPFMEDTYLNKFLKFSVNDRFVGRWNCKIWLKRRIICNIKIGGQVSTTNFRMEAESYSF